MAGPQAGPLRQSPTKWKTSDGEAVVQALQEASTNPVETEELESAAGTNTEETERAASVHTEIQYLLVKLGADMGFDVHVAPNDQGRVWRGQRLNASGFKAKRLSVGSASGCAV